MKNLLKIFVVIIANCTLLIINCSAADRFWIAGSTGDWNHTANWSTSSGGSGGASVPGSSDVAKFDGNGTGNCTINTTVNVAGINMGSGYSGTIAQGSYAVTIGSSHFTQAGGTFTGGDATIDLNGKFYLTGGSFTATSGNFYAGSYMFDNSTKFTHSGGTFTHNSGTMIFDYTAAGVSSPIDIMSSTLFNHLKINNGSYAQITTATGDTVKAEGNFEHAGGWIRGGHWLFKGNLTVGSSAQMGQGVLIFSGTANQTYSYTAGGRTCALAVNKSSGTVTAASGTSNFAGYGLSIYAGSFTAPEGNLDLGGAVELDASTKFLHSGGTFSHNNGTLVLGYANFTTVPLDVLSSTLFNNIKLNNVSGFRITTATGDTVKAEGNFEHAGGIITGGNWLFKGNLTVGSSAQVGQGVLIFGGTANQTYSYTAGGRTCWIAVNKSSGTVTAASGTTNFAGYGLSIYAGSFTAPEGNLDLGGAVESDASTKFLHSGGTFSHNNGTLVLGYANFTTVPLDVLSSTLFNNIKLNNVSGFRITTATGDTVKAEGNFEHAGGIITGGNWLFKGNLTVGSSAGGGLGELIAAGTANQTYAYSAGGRICKLTINKTSGTTSAASGITDFAVQGFTLKAGTFNAPTGNFFIGGNLAGHYTVFEQTGGTFNANNGTLVVDPYNGNYNYTLKPHSSTTFYKLTAKPTGSLLLQSATDTLKVDNNLKLEQGTFSTGVLAAKAKVTVNSGWTGGTAQLLFCGSSDQDFDLTSATDKYNGNVKIKKPSGKVNLLSACVLDASSQTLTFVKGTIATTATNLLTLGDNVTVSGMSDSSYVEGPMKKTGNDAFTFPVGNLTPNPSPSGEGHYRPISISAPGNTTDAFTAQYFEQNSNDTYSHSAKDGTLAELSRNEYWNLARTTGTSNVSVTLSIDSATSCSVDNLSNLKVAAWDGSTWKDKGNGGTSGDVYVGTVVTNGVSNVYGVYTVGTSTTCTCNKFDFCGEFLEPEFITEPEEVDTLLGLKIFDRFGNEYLASDIMRGGNTGNYSCQAGYFTLDFLNTDPNVVTNPYGYSDLTNGAMYRELTCRVFEDISQMLDHGPQDGRVRVRVLNASPGSQFGAAASSLYNTPYNASEGIIETDVARTIKTGQDAYLYTVIGGMGIYHAQLEVNFAVSDPWYWVNSGSAMQLYEVDAYTAILHEALHMLGISSLIDSDGSSRAQGSLEFYTLWDLGLEVSNTDIINYTPPYTTSYSSVTLNHDCSPTTVFFDDVNCINDAVYSPETWSGNSLSHFNCRPDGGSCPQNTYVIKDCISQGPYFVNRHPNQQEYFAICDIGYQLTTTYGIASMIPNSDDVYTLYDSYEECEENECLVTGTDDLYFMSFDHGTLDISDALNNDFTSGGTLSFFDNSMFTSSGDLTGIITQSGGNATYTPTAGFYGHTIINYVPECEDGSVGTMAFIHIYVEPEPLPPCEENPCTTNLICHGDFEILEDDFALPLSNARLGGSNSPDLYPVRQTQMAGAWTTQNCSNVTSLPNPVNPPNPNNQYIGMGGSANNRELIYFKLQQPLIQGITYDFSFDYNARCNTILRLIFSENEPCHLNPINELTGVNCTEGGSYEPLQMEEFALTPSTVVGPNSIWSSENVQITPDFGNMKYLVITQAQCAYTGNICYTLFDNFELLASENLELEVTSVVTSETPCIGSTTQINYSICNNTSEVIPETTLHINLDDGLTVLPNDFFDENGDVVIPELEPSECFNDVLLDIQISSDNEYAEVPLEAELVSISGACINNLTSVNTITPQNNYLTITKTVTNGSSFQSGAIVNYEVEVCNIATDPLLTITDIEVTDILPEGFLDGSVISSDFTDDNSTLTATIASLAPGTCETLSFSVQVMSASTSQCDDIITLENCVQITSAEEGCAYGESCVNIEVTSDDIVDGSYTGNDVLGTLTVSSDIVASQSFSIEGTLTIASSLTLSGCDILMQPEAIIVVETGQTLTVTGTHIYGCDEMWDQIQVEDGATIIVDGNSLIEDAEIAIHCLDEAILNIDDAVFNKNYRHLFIDYQTGGGNYNPGPIINSHFLCQVDPTDNTDATLLAPHATERTFRGIEIEGDIIMDIGSFGQGNEFRNGEAGIFSHNGTQLSVIDNSFTNMWAGVALNNIFGMPFNSNHQTTLANNDFTNCVAGAMFFGNTDARLDVSKTNEFTDCYIGLWSWINNRCHIRVHGANTFTNSGASPFGDEGYGILGSNWFNINDGSVFQVVDNQFENLRFGIHLTNTYGTYIANNVIQVNDYPLLPPDPLYTPPAGGIWLGYNMYSFVHDNTITGTLTAADWEYWRSGIRSDMVPLNHVFCNVTENIDIGLDIVGEQPYTSFNANTMQGYHNAGIKIAGFEEPWGTTTGANLVPDNKWMPQGTNNWGNFGAHTYAATDLSDVEFYLRDDAPSVYNPGLTSPNDFMINDGGDPGFVISPFAITPDHSAISCEAYPYFMIRPVDEAKALVQDESTTAYSKLNKYMTYLLLKQDTLLHADSLITEDIVLDSVYQNDSLLLAFKDSMAETTIGRIDEVLEDIELNMTKGEGGNIWSLYSTLYNITPADSIEYFMKKMGLLTLLRTSTNDLNFTETEIDDLHELAQKCPFIFGPGVFMARLTLMQIDSLPVLYQSECEAYYPMDGSGKWDGEDTETEEQENQVEDAQFKLYPNPNDGTMFLEYRNLAETAWFEMYDVTGRKIAFYNLTTESGKLSITEQGLSNGIYAYRIMSDNYKYKFGKIIIRK